MESYNKGPKIGEGTYGIVYSGSPKANPEFKLALKKILRKNESEGVNFTALREIKSLQEIDHPNIIKLLEVFVYKKSVYLVFPLMEFDLEAVIKDPKIPFKPAEIKCYMKMILEGVAHLHSRWIIHRDLKPNNLLMDSNGILKLADFGFARTFASPNSRLTANVVTLWYRSPELLFGAASYGPPIDLWSVGCIFAELMIRVPYFAGTTEIEQLGKIFAALGTPTEEEWQGMKYLPSYLEFEKIPATPMRTLFPAASDDSLTLLAAFLKYDPSQRITAAQALKHSYFSSNPPPIDSKQLPIPQKRITLQKSSPAEAKSPNKRPISNPQDVDRPKAKRKLDLESDEEKK